MALVKGTEPWAQLTASGGTRIGGNVACLSLNGILPLRPPPPHGSVDGATWETRVQGVPARPLMSQHFPVQAHAWQPVAARISLPLAMVPERRDGSRGGGKKSLAEQALPWCVENSPCPCVAPWVVAQSVKGRRQQGGWEPSNSTAESSCGRPPCRRQAPVCRKGPRPAVIAAGSRWHSPTLPGPLRPPALSRVGLALRSSPGAPLARRPGSVLRVGAAVPSGPEPCQPD